MPCATMRLIHGHVGVFTVFFMVFYVGENLCSLCLLSAGDLFAVPDCVLRKQGVKTSREQGAYLFQVVLPQEYSDDKILPAVLKSFSIPFEEEKSDTVPGTKQDSNQPNQ